MCHIFLLLTKWQTESEEERERVERERQANLKKEEEEGKKSGLPSSGNNTPSGRKEKKAGTGSDRERVSSARSLKRPGSPNLSEGSGTDASTRRKKLKSKHLSSTQPTPGPSRPMSPANVPPSSSAPQTLDPKIRRRAGGAGSDTEAGVSDRDGGAMSDGSRTARRLKLKMSASPPGTNPPSRAASPAPGAAPRGAPSPVAIGSPTAFPSVQDIKNAIPAQGIAIKELMKIVAHPKERRADFVNLVKEVARMDKERGVLVLK